MPVSSSMPEHALVASDLPDVVDLVKCHVSRPFDGCCFSLQNLRVQVLQGRKCGKGASQLPKLAFGSKSQF
eukprot:12926825-Prorocentrum_lima.AAC.1